MVKAVKVISFILTINIQSSKMLVQCISLQKCIETYGEYSQKPLYIGQSSELGTRIASHEKWECVNNHGCTHINVMAVTGDQARLDAETDLIHKYDPICNLQ